MSLSLDRPKNSREQDSFQRYEFAKRIAGMLTLTTSENSMVVGLYGKWGEGKTSVMNFVKNELPDDSIIVDFNPWLFNDQEHLLTAFFRQIAAALNASIDKPKEHIGKLLSDYGDLIGNIKFAGFGLTGLGNMGRKLKDVTVDSLKKRVDAIIRTADKKVFVFVDDIDRLDVREIQYIFKLIKLAGDFCHTSYVLAFDDEMVAAALAPQYGEGQKANGYQFLEKIVQVPLVLPKATKAALVRYTITLLDDAINKIQISLTKAEVDRFRTVFDDCFVPAISNPRLASRYANSLIFAIPLLFGEVAVSDLMLAEALKIFYPQAYDFMRMNGPFFLTNNMRERGTFMADAPDKGTILAHTRTFLDSFDEKARRRINGVWQELFPQYSYITTNSGYPEDSWRDWYRAKRICSGRYFERYFTYAVLEGDVSDVFFDQFLLELADSSNAEVRPKLDTLFESVPASDIIFKLRLWEDRLDENQSKKLAEVLAEIIDQLPVEPNEFRMFTTRMEGVKTIAQLIINQPKNQRSDSALSVFELVRDFEDAIEIANHLFYKDEKELFKQLTQQDHRKIKDYFVKRFKRKIAENDFFKAASDNNLWQMMIWWKEWDEKDYKSFIGGLLNGEPDRAIALIGVFARTITSWGGQAGPQTYKGGFDESRYDALSGLVDPQPIYDILDNAGGYRIRNVALSHIDDKEAMTDKELGNVFIQFYEHKQQTGSVN